MKSLRRKKIPDHPIEKKDEILSNCPQMDVASASCASPGRVIGGKHHATPLKTRSKTSKGKVGEDVHSSVSPVTPKSRLSRSKNTSPVVSNLPNSYYLGVCSQELPDVIWDYTSPKNSTRNNRLDSITLGEFLNNMQYSDPDNNNGSNTLTYAELIEKWNMFRTKSPAAPKISYRCQPKGPKKPPRVILKEMRKFFTAINEPEGNSDMEVVSGTSGMCKESDVAKSTCSTSRREFKREETASSLDEDGNDLDSEDELWGVNFGNDDEVIVKATQDLEACLISHAPTLSRVIPETCRETQYPSRVSLSAKQSEDIHRRLRSCTQIIASKFSNIPDAISEEPVNEDCVSDIAEWDWDSDCEDINWTDDMSVIDTLSQVPDDILQGCNDSAVASELPINSTVAAELHINSTVAAGPPINSTVSAELAINSSIAAGPPINSTVVSDFSNKSNTVLAETIGFDISIHPQNEGQHVVSPVKSPVDHDGNEGVSCMEDRDPMNYFQMLLDTDSDVFNDESLFNEAAETTVSPLSRPLCTPQEIAMKKEEALKKLKERQTKRH